MCSPGAVFYLVVRVCENDGTHLYQWYFLMKCYHSKSYTKNTQHNEPTHDSKVIPKTNTYLYNIRHLKNRTPR